MDINPPPGANSGFGGYQINKINTFGIVINSYVFEDFSGNFPNRLLVASDGGYYFNSKSHPESPDDISSIGRINKLSSDMTTLEWTFIPPNDPLNDGRFYRIFDYTETQNGDIIASGMVRDDTDSEIEGPDKNTVWNGCMIRFNPAGEIIWLKVYKQPNDLVSQDDFGRFRPSRINEVIELADGRLVAAGDVFVNSNQLFNINEFETEAFHAWLMITDEDGCLEDYSCEEIIRFTEEEEYTYHIGAQWIYETKAGFAGPPTTSFITREVIDTLIEGDRVKYILNFPIDTFYVEDSKMFFWDNHYEEYIMYFDFASTTEYDIKYWNAIQGIEGIANIVIDSIGYELFDTDTLKVQYVTVTNSGTISTPYQTKVYDGIGDADQDILFLLGCGLCDPPRTITQIRCFTNDTVSYQFVPYPCDSTFIVTSVEDLLEEKIIIYPNPTVDGLVNIDGLDQDVVYELYALDGRLLQSGRTTNHSLLITTPGLHLLKLKVEDHWIVKKVVR